MIVQQGICLSSNNTRNRTRGVIFLTKCLNNQCCEAHCTQGYADTPAGRVWQPYSEAQIDALILLLKDIVQRHHLPIDSIIGHSDIAPQRKVDPGPLFPWWRLADAGLIRWPDAAQVARQQALFSQQLPAPEWFAEQLRQLGYAVPTVAQADQPLRNVLAALQMKYRPSNVDGQPDAETAAILQVLNQAR
mgnify:CR=1 FL=1